MRPFLKESRAFVARFARNQRGNTIALVAAVLLPLLGLIGGGVDMSRLYLTKARLQQACDAGALAGRKALGVNAWSSGGTADTTANSMFSGNFRSGAYGSGTLTKSYSASNGTVTGTASVVVPMTVMKAFGMADRTINVTCSAEMAIPNTDVMFVLDVTGSMNDLIPGDTVTKISGLKKAVKCFYEALERVNTTEVCGNDPTATTYTGTAQIRIGFVPYSINVNVGKLLPNDYFADSWSYQSRHRVMYRITATGSGSSYTETSYFSRSRSCSNWASGYGQVGFPAPTDPPPDTFVGTTNNYSLVPNGYNSNTGACTRQINQSVATYTRDDANGTDWFDTWIYRQETFDVSGLKAGGSNWNNSITLPIGTDGANRSIPWEGCIEERHAHVITDTDPSNDYSPIPSDAYDLDIDMIPSSTTTYNSYWGPVLRYTAFTRMDSSGNYTTSDVQTDEDPVTDPYPTYTKLGGYACPTQAKLLQTWTTSSPFEAYVNSLTPGGNTYHDIGMVWGARFISPTGMFAATNTNLTNIQRHIIFMTDGDTNTNNSNYSSHGIDAIDRRQTSYAPTSANGDDIVDARLTALCTAIKNRNITLWVISYGSVSGSTATRLQNCATSGKYFSASSSSNLIAQFQSIASAISDLRLTN